MVGMIFSILTACTDTEEKTLHPPIVPFALIETPEADLNRDPLDLFENPIWLPPRQVITNHTTSTGKILTLNLVKVEIQIYPEIDCNYDTRHIDTAQNRIYLAPITQEELANYGEVVSTKEIWIVLGSARIQRALGYRSKPPDIEEIELGPSWLGIPLQLVNQGERVFFDASHNCNDKREYRQERPIYLPTKAFRYFSSYSYDLLELSQKQPFTARIIEVCSQPTLTVHEQNKVEHNLVYGDIHRSTRTNTVTAECPSSGSQIFTNVIKNFR